MGARPSGQPNPLSQLGDTLPGRSGVEYTVEVVDYVTWDDSLYVVPVGSTIRDQVEAEDVQGIHVHVYDPENPSDDHWWWIWSFDQLDWDQWDYQIGLNSDMHNFAVA